MSLKKGLLFLMIALLSVGMANAAIDGKKFCFVLVESANGGYESVTVSQQDADSYVPADEEACDDEWSIFFELLDGAPVGKLVLGSDIDMGGYSTDALGVITCNETYYLTGNFAELDGGNHTVKNFCDISVGAEAGFFSFGEGGSVKDIVFDGAYVESKSGTAGVVAASLLKGGVENITIENSTVVGNTAGLVVGDESSMLSIGKISISNSSVKGRDYVGGAFGSVGASGLKIQIQNFSSENVTVTASASTAKVGGFAGYASNVEFLKPTVLGGSVKLAGYTGASTGIAGGLVGDYSPYMSSTEMSATVGAIVDADISGAQNMGGLFGLIRGDNSVARSVHVTGAEISGSIGGSCAAESHIGGVVGSLGDGLQMVLEFTVENTVVASSVMDNYGSCAGSKVTFSFTDEDSAMVGGLIGSCIGDYNEVKMNANAVVGDVKINDGGAPAANKRVSGYLAGQCLAANLKSVVGNYHYGLDDEESANPFGHDVGDTYANSKVSGNVRNAVGNLTSDASLIDVLEPNRSWMQIAYGVVPSAEMKKSKYLAYVLNLALDNKSLGKEWIQDAGSEDDGVLPYISASDDYTPRYIAFRMHEDVVATLTDAEKKALEPFDPQYRYDGGDSLVVSLFTNRFGKLGDEWDAVAKSLTAKVEGRDQSYVWRPNYGSANLPRFAPGIVYEYEGNMDLIANSTFKLNYLVNNNASSDEVRPFEYFMGDDAVTNKFDKVFVTFYSETFTEGDSTAMIPMVVAEKGGVLSALKFRGFANMDEVDYYERADGSYYKPCARTEVGVECDDQNWVYRHEVSDVATLDDMMKKFVTTRFYSQYTNAAPENMALDYSDVTTSAAPILNLFFEGNVDYSEDPVTVESQAYELGAKDFVTVNSLTYDASEVIVASPSVFLGEKLKVALPDIPEKTGYTVKNWEVRLAVDMSGSYASLQTAVEGSAIAGKTLAAVVKGMVEGQSGYTVVDVSKDGIVDLSSFVAEVRRQAVKSGKSDADLGNIAYGMAFVPVYETNEYKIVFDAQVDGGLFAPNKWKLYDAYVADVTLAANAFPVYYRAGYCLDGWMATKSSTKSYINLDENLLSELEEKYPEAKQYTVYAKWSEMDPQGMPCGTSTITLEVEGQGTLRLVQYTVDGNDSLVNEFVAPADGGSVYTLAAPARYYGTVSVFAVPAKNFVNTSITFANSDGAEASVLYSGEEASIRTESSPKFTASFISAGPYDVVFDVVNAEIGDDKLTLDASKMFFASVEKTNELALASQVNIGDTLPYLYSMDGYVTHEWMIADGQQTNQSVYDINVHNGIVKLDDNTLSGGWVDLYDTWTIFVVNNDVKNATVALSQKIGSTVSGVKLSDKALKLPYPDKGRAYTFEVNVTPDEGHVLVGDVKWTTVYVPDDGGREDISSDAEIIPLVSTCKNGGLMTLSESETPEWAVESKRFNVVLEAEIAAHTAVALDKNTENKDLFYGADLAESVDVLSSENVKDEVALPQYIYTSNSCVLGWAGVATGAKTSLQSGAQNGDVWAAVAESKTPTLYAVWGDSKACVDSELYDMISVELDSKHGDVEFLEIREGSKDTIVHNLAADKTILIPANSGKNFLFMASSLRDSVEVESIVLTVKDADGKSRSDTLKNGDALPESLKGAAIAVHYLDNRVNPNDTDPEFVLREVLTSNNAVLFNYEISDFDVNDSSVVRLSLVRDDDGLVDSILVKGRGVAAFKSSWEMYPLKPGDYLLTAEILDGDSLLAHFEQDFEVVTAFAEVKAGEWAMVSLGYVDMDSVNWDDAYFYWWDESRNFGDFWQYQAFREDGKAEMGRGYWYSSDEGLALSLTDESLADPVAEWVLDSVYSGWNLVANPYGWYLDLCAEEECPEDDEKSDVQFYRWNGEVGDYEPVTVLKPYEAVWAKVSASKTWTLSSKPAYVVEYDSNMTAQVGALAKAAVLSKASAVDNWSLSISLADENGKRDGWNVIGVGAEAWNAEEPPEGMGDHVNLSIVDGSRGMSKYFKKAAAGNAYEWTVELSASTRRSGYLSVAGANDLRAYGLKVYVTVDGETTEVADGENVQVALSKAAKQATIRVAPGASRMVAFRIDGLRAAQVGKQLQVSFNATDGLAGAAAHVDLMDMKGHVLRSVSGRTVAGENQVALDLPKSGLYLLRVRAGSQMNAGKVMVK